MVIKKSINELPEIGYLYHYTNPTHPTDKFRMDIFISSKPTERHFDVLRAHFFIKGPREAVERLTVTHPWKYDPVAHVCAGMVIMEDRKGKKEEAFTFGGQLKIDGQESQTICNLVSRAPIIEISGATPIHRFFVEEIEIELAEYRARYLNGDEYERHICEVDPFILYLACLGTLIEKLEGFQHKDEEYRQLLVDLHSQVHRLDVAGLIEDSLPTLESIFG
jgi:hypothetical protein